jgi:hypothetical protein
LSKEVLNTTASILVIMKASTTKIRVSGTIVGHHKVRLNVRICLVAFILAAFFIFHAAHSGRQKAQDMILEQSSGLLNASRSGAHESALDADSGVIVSSSVEGLGAE